MFLEQSLLVQQIAWERICLWGLETVSISPVSLGGIFNFKALMIMPISSYPQMTMEYKC